MYMLVMHYGIEVYVTCWKLDTGLIDNHRWNSYYYVWHYILILSWYSV